MFCVLIFALVELARSATARFLQSALAQSAQQRSPKCLLLDPTCDRDSDLFTPNYNRYRSPSLSEDAEGDPTVVYMQLLLSSVPSLCTAAQRLSFTALAEYSWHDPRLNLSRVSDNQYVQLPEQLVERIWKPTLSLLPAAFIRGLNSTEDIQAHVSPDQKIVMSFRIYVSLFCKMDLYFYPFDVHVCDMSIVNVGSDDHQSILRWIGDERSPYRVSEQSIYWSSAQSSISNFRCSHILPLSIVDNLRGGRRRTRLIIRVRMQRRLAGPLMSIYVPSIITVILSWIGFWQDPSKVHFRIIVTSLCFVLITFQQSTQTMVPRHDHYVMSTDYWYMMCYIFVLASLVEFIVIQKLEGWEKLEHTSTSDVSSRVTTTRTRGLMKKVSASEIDDACKTFFPLIFFFVTLAYGIGFGSHLLVAGDPTVIAHQSLVQEGA